MQKSVLLQLKNQYEKKNYSVNFLITLFFAAFSLIMKLQR